MLLNYVPALTYQNIYTQKQDKCSVTDAFKFYK